MRSLFYCPKGDLLIQVWLYNYVYLALEEYVMVELALFCLSNQAIFFGLQLIKQFPEITYTCL